LAPRSSALGAAGQLVKVEQGAGVEGGVAQAVDSLLQGSWFEGSQ